MTPASTDPELVALRDELGRVICDMKLDVWLRLNPAVGERAKWLRAADRVLGFLATVDPAPEPALEPEPEPAPAPPPAAASVHAQGGDLAPVVPPSRTRTRTRSRAAKAD